MNKTLKALPLAIAMSFAFAAGTANATVEVDDTLNLGTLGSTISPLAFFHGAGSFEDVIQFDIGSTSNFSAALFNFNIANFTTTISRVTSAQAALFSSTPIKASVESSNPFLTSTFASLTSGTYQLTVSGIAGKWFGGGYGIAMNAVSAPVPEPESYAMLLAGLGLMGTIARRRSKNNA